MPRPFVVVGKSVAIVADLDDCFVEIDKLVAARRLPASRSALRVALAKNRIERVLREDVLDVGDEQFLMLLFVMNAEDEDRFDFIEQTFVGDLRADRRCANRSMRDSAVFRLTVGREINPRRSRRCMSPAAL